MGPDKFQNITTILFDLDNTLINSKAAERIASDHVFNYLVMDGVRPPNARASVDKFLSSVRDEAPQGEAWRLLQWRHALGPAHATRAAASDALWRAAHTRALRPCTGVDDLLLALRHRFKVGLIVPRDAEEPRWGGSFDVVVGGGTSVGWAWLLEEACRRLDSAPLECALVTGGREEVVRMARRAGLGAVVRVEDGGAVEDADAVVRDVRDIPEVLPEGRGFTSRCQQRRLGFFHSLREEGWMNFG
ncbi:hypothetical protein JTE90_021249 [Oedothorax gibbosus]|uniref:Uncharacterized protein n=1 Tax=Oedothorax gibbosus TaxID=931172 RepID=A0AAV6UWZ8_9ARAC|nr:hypothetical protein JTE90_021249 [Oedothorax gibbosus]